MIIKKIKNQKTNKTTQQQISDLVDYIRAPHKVNPEEKLEYEGGKNFTTSTHNGQKKEMVHLAKESAHSKMPVTHWLISWQENEQPTHAQIEQCVEIFLEGMGLKGHQIIYGLHKNTENLHLHIAVNRMNESSMKVVQPHKGFDIEAAHKILAKIEAVQGWAPLKNARYVMLENGEIARKKSGEREIKPTQKALDFENARGEKSAQRIAQERGHEIISNAKSWQELHEKLEKNGLRFAKRGAGSVIFVGDIAVKSSSVDRKFSLKNLCKKLGEFEDGLYKNLEKISVEPVSNINADLWEEYQNEQKKLENFGQNFAQKNDEKKEISSLTFKNLQKNFSKKDGYFLLEPVVLDKKNDQKIAKKIEGKYGKRTIIKKPHSLKNRSASGDSLRRLSECNLAHYSERQQKIPACFLSHNALLDRHGYDLMRWGDGFTGREKFRLKRESFKEKNTHKRGNFSRQKLPRFKDWLLKKGLKKEADLWRHRDTFEEKNEKIFVKNWENFEGDFMANEAKNFNRYSHAVSAERYRVTCIKMLKNGEKKTFILDKKNGETHGFTDDEIHQNLPQMLRIQARGENIYYTPLSEKKHHILIDDMTAEAVNKLRVDGYKAAALIQSSPGNFQCILTIPKLGTEFDRDVGNRLTEMLNREYGDKKLSGCIHPHRAPGFQNRKPKHQREDGSFPEVKLLEAIRQECPKALELSKKLNAEIAQATSASRQRAAQFAREQKNQNRPGSPVAAYQAHLNNIRQHLTIEDASRVDSMIALRMRATGHSQEAVRNTIEECAPAMRESSERRDWKSYAHRTAAYAFGVAGDRDLSRNEKYIEHWKKIENPDYQAARQRRRMR